jgi:carboxyl-terminal processing protease
VSDTYFDPDFGGLDWRAVHDRYEPLLAEVVDDAALYELLNEMLRELNRSHTGAIPLERWSIIEPELASEGEVGIEVRLLDGESVITRVEPSSPAEQAGLRTGFVLESVDGASIGQLIAEAEPYLGPPYNEPSRLSGVTRYILSRIYGPQDASVTLTYMDGHGETYDTAIKRVGRDRQAKMPGIPLPPSYLEFEAKRLEHGIGYIRFNAFFPDLIPDLLGAIESMADAPGIIIDLRGNPGGHIQAGEALIAQFIQEPAHVGGFRTRDGAVDFVVEPAENTFVGPVLILIDNLSFSCSEWVSGAMQAIGRARIVGQPSPGGLTGMGAMTLPNGGLLLHPTLQILGRDGTDLEGQGVIPDIQVQLAKDQLLLGIDAQIEAAIDHVEGLMSDDDA